MKKLELNASKQNLIIHIILTVVTLAVYWQVNYYDFIIEDKPHLVEGSYVQYGITMEGIRWAFSTTYYYLWQPLFWLSFMFDYHLYGLNAGGYHLTNLVLHIFNTLLLFGLLNRMTADVWKSAFIAACFALHPLNVESVAWVSQRKNVLCVFFWMITLWLYVYYTKKSSINRYLLVMFAYVLALMSKPMVVTLPAIMILLDYWPLSRCRLGVASQKSNLILWQLKEKTPFFILSIIVSMITLYAQKYNLSDIHGTLTTGFAKASFAFVTYLQKMFWPHDLAFCHPSSMQMSAGQVGSTVLLIIFITVAITVMVKRMPYLFVGWFWYAITIFPVIGIIHSDFVPLMFDHFTYLPSIGIFIMLAWGIPEICPNKDICKKFLFPAAFATLLIWGVLSWKQCGYWKNSITLFNHTLEVTKDNSLAYHHLGYLYDGLGWHQMAVNHYNEAIRIKPRSARFYNNRGISFAKLGQYQDAVKDFNQAIYLQPDLKEAYINRGSIQMMEGNKEAGCADAQKACNLGDCTLIEKARDSDYCR